MNPFDAPPSTPAVSYEPPQQPKRRRGRMIGAALVGAGLVGAGAIGVSALVSADDPELATTTATTTPTTTTEVEPSGDGPVDEGPTVGPAEGDWHEFAECIGVPAVGSGELPPLDEWWGDGSGELPPLDDLFGPGTDLDGLLDELLGDLERELDGQPGGGLPALDDVLGELERELNGREGEPEGDARGLMRPADEPTVATSAPAEPFGDDLVAVIGPDGPILIDLGDGAGSVTVERDADGEIVVTTDGSATEVDMDELIGTLVDDVIAPGLPDEWRTCLDDLTDE